MPRLASFTEKLPVIFYPGLRELNGQPGQVGCFEKVRFFLFLGCPWNIESDKWDLIRFKMRVTHPFCR